MALGEEDRSLRAVFLDEGGHRRGEQLFIQRQQPARFSPDRRIELSEQDAEDLPPGVRGASASLTRGFGKTVHQRANLGAGRQAIQVETLVRYSPKVGIRGGQVKREKGGVRTKVAAGTIEKIRQVHAGARAGARL